MGSVSEFTVLGDEVVGHKPTTPSAVHPSLKTVYECIQNMLKTTHTNAECLFLENIAMMFKKKFTKHCYCVAKDTNIPESAFVHQVVHLLGMQDILLQVIINKDFCGAGIQCTLYVPISMLN